MESVRIIYSQKENIAYCMWKYFFDSCGIWVLPQTVEEYENSQGDKGENQGKEHRPTLYILSEDEKHWISNAEQNQVVYFVSLNLWNQYPHKEREDVIPIVWKDRKKIVFCKYLLHKLAVDVGVSFYLTSLLEAFFKYELWGNAWLYREINLDNTAIWDVSKYNSCQQYLDELHKNMDPIDDNRYQAFAEIYYSYIRDGIKDKKSDNQIDNVTQLLYLCQKYTTRYGESSALYYLMGKICSLSLSEKKTTLLFYHNIPMPDYTAEVLYMMGREYEKNYNDQRMADEFYLKSYNTNRNYKALYKIAIRFDKQKEWQSALTLYERILNEIRSNYKNDSITINNIEYEYKVTVRIAEIYKKYVKAPDMVEDARNYLQTLYSSLNEREEFKGLFTKMFGKKALQINNELWLQIRERFQTTCFSNSVL